MREMLTSPRVSLEPIGFVDDNKMKKGAVIHGIQVLGEVARIPGLVAEYRFQEVIIAMPTAPGKMIREIVGLCEEAGVACRSMPGISFHRRVRGERRVFPVFSPRTLRSLR
ncbi:MAG: hypothetical protein ABIL11_01925 [Chloroflexota bacterium]